MQLCGIAGIYLSFGAAAIAYISCEAAERLKLADSAKLFALTFLLVTFGAHDRISMLYCATPCPALLCWSVHIPIMLCTLACLASGVHFTWQLCMLCFTGRR